MIDQEVSALSHFIYIDNTNTQTGSRRYVSGNENIILEFDHIHNETHTYVRLENLQYI